MAYVRGAKGRSKIKPKRAFSLSRRQLICFSIAAVIGIPTYLFTRAHIGNSPAVLLRIGLMLPCFFFAMFERDGLPFEKVLCNIVRTCYLWPRVRPYQTQNFYAALSGLDKEAKTIDPKADRAAKRQPAHQKAQAKKGRSHHRTADHSL